MRHGVGAARGFGGRRRRRRACGDDPAPGGGGGPYGAADGAALLRRGAASCVRVAATGAGHARGAVGRRSFLRARLGLHRQPQPEHVHPGRPGDRGLLPLQRGGDAGARRLPHGRGVDRYRDCPVLLRERGRHYHPGAAWPGAGAAGAAAHGSGASRAAAARPADRAPP